MEVSRWTPFTQELTHLTSRHQPSAEKEASILPVLFAVLFGLNKGERLHSLARDIAFGWQGRFHDRGYEAQLNWASARALVINTIAVWNTRYFERA